MIIDLFAYSNMLQHVPNITPIYSDKHIKASRSCDKTIILEHMT